MAIPTKKVDISTPKVEKANIGQRCTRNCSKLVCKAPANNKKLSMMSKSTSLKSICVMIYFSAFNKVLSKALKAKTPKVNRIVININPIVLGNFKNRTLMYPKTAEIVTRLVIIRK